MGREDLVKILTSVRDSMLDEHFPRNPKEINNGFCADFATIVWEKMGGKIRIISDEDMMPEIEYTHTFIEYDDMYYDAECVEGVDDWTQLPIFHRNGLNI